MGIVRMDVARTDTGRKDVFVSRRRIFQLSERLEDARRYSPDVMVLVAGDFNFDIT